MVISLEQKGRVLQTLLRRNFKVCWKTQRYRSTMSDEESMMNGSMDAGPSQIASTSSSSSMPPPGMSKNQMKKAAKQVRHQVRNSSQLTFRLDTRSIDSSDELQKSQKGKNEMQLLGRDMLPVHSAPRIKRSTRSERL